MTRVPTVVATFAILVLAGPIEAQERADLIVHNGVIFTADDRLSIHSSMVVRDGRVIAVGGPDLPDRYDAPNVVDLKGRFVVPGFNDTHTHIRGVPRRYVDMSGVTSLSEFQERLRRKATEFGPGEWIIGWGWSEDEMAERRKPTRADLDAVIPENPAVISRAGGHSAVASSLALQLGGVTRDTPDPVGGIIERDETGEPTGVFRENWSMISRLVPAAPDAELRESLIENLKRQFAFGITSFIEAMTPPARFEMWQDVYGTHHEPLPRAAVQIHISVGFGEGQEAADRLKSLSLRTGQGDERLRVGALKIFVDGGYTGPAAWTLEPYPDQPDYHGHARLGEEDFFVVAKAAHDMGWQLGIHAIGDAAIKLSVDQIVRLLRESPRTDHRHYLNHFTVLPPRKTMQEMADHNIHIAQQPNFTWTLDGPYSRHLSTERAQTNNALRTPMSYGIFMALGADIIPTSPLLGIFAATTRRGMSGAVFGNDERLSVPEAIVGYTRNGAYLTFEESLKGTLEPGKYADFVVLSDDIRCVSPDRIRETQVLHTYLGGELVYSRPPESTTLR
jgi:predicted amidohydrolase YtcJ